ncbi:MAG: bifunctional methylenetetrahydrofolate dehydrogenase/methenyltetrahydrofolate cyclohydrolase FolD [Bacteroidales bacterium]|nr:bifunctional methylenetetrahydrofolate dehydrogenase/methenyltetrahydrofolate cyclohydrolase FolD [Bacteroidales bacterium]
MGIIDGKKIAAELRAEVAEKVAGCARAPHLAVIVVGDDPASAVYVRNKARACESTGIRNTTIALPAETSEAELLAAIAGLNADDAVDGILVQLPLPKHISEERVIASIALEKDVDGFHPGNVAALFQKRPCTVPCTPKGIMKLLEAYGVEPKGKRAVVIGRSLIVGLPVAKLLLDANATVTICHTRTADLAAVTREADIIVAATGHSGTLRGDMVREGAVVIDVGINRAPDGTLCGDVVFDDVAPKASLITPVPGGVGPMTIACLLENTLDLYLKRYQ